MSWLPDSVRWYATLVIIALAFAPFARWIGSRLPDKGASLALPVGLLATIWPTWYLASVTPFPFSTVGLWATVAIGAAAGWYFAVRLGWITRDWLIALVTAQAVLLVAFVA